MPRVFQFVARFWNPLATALKARPFLEQLSWIAGIASAALAFFLWLAAPKADRVPEQSAGSRSASSTEQPNSSQRFPMPSAQGAPISFVDWASFKKYAALKIVEVNPSITYMDKPPDVLRSIPFFDIDLNADGSIAKLRVRRVPSFNVRDMEAVAAAINRAAPFGDVSALPQPWTFTEGFLIRDDGKFTPVSLNKFEPSTD